MIPRCSITRIDVEIRIVYAMVGMVDINRFGRNIQITQPDCWFLWIELGIEISAETSEPDVIRHVFVRRDLIALRHVGVDDRDAVDYRLNDPEVIVIRALTQPVLHRFRHDAGQCRHSVVPDRVAALSPPLFLGGSNIR